MKTKTIHHSQRDQGRMGFKQAVDKAVSAFIRSPDGRLLDLDCFDPGKTLDPDRQEAVVQAFARFLAESF